MDNLSFRMPAADGFALERALEQRTALLHEVDHRVKNNLQLIASLLRLQIRRTEDATVRRALEGMHARVSAVATVHRRLFQSEDVGCFDLADFVRDLAHDAAHSARRGDIGLRLELEPVSVDAAKAAPLALVINELLCNALQHGYPDGRTGEIHVGVRRRDGTVRIEVADDGVGRKVDDEPGFGLAVVSLLCRQLAADCRTDGEGPGVRTVITLSEEAIG